MKKGVVLSVEDDQAVQTVLEIYLEEEGYTFCSALRADEALRKLDAEKPDVILLDLVLPDADGLALIPQIKNKSNAALIIVSGKNDTTEKIVCLEMGADDYITKPFEMRELSARIRAVLRRSKDEEAVEPKAADEKKEKLQFLDWCLDRTKYQLFDSRGQSVDLTTGEFRLLEALLLASNRVLSREQLFDLTRDGRFDAYDRAIDIQVARIRKKLGDNGELIKTIRGVGYMLSTDAA